jgi:hypothetical protein
MLQIMKMCSKSFSQVHYYTLNDISKVLSVYALFTKSNTTTISLNLWRLRTRVASWVVDCISRQCNIQSLCLPCQCIEEIFPLMQYNNKPAMINNDLKCIILIFTNTLLYFNHILVKQHHDGRKTTETCKWTYI